MAQFAPSAHLEFGGFVAPVGSKFLVEVSPTIVHFLGFKVFGIDVCAFHRDLPLALVLLS